ncbi:acyltransferase family protein [Spirosoma fluviale]|uniref:Peptidoglycan/LPS O-acetylase OafA/YrhL, contains acyltransferase and SGNH-hydrolase domains n=1 Tax=Spirosoma fluviale TaxID=1597977 RepID=A0A286FBK9_9BACT|nr:acyltransferase [Spirosoma fluviale]SOD80617.1 Peptidoglycan/LPS O-acetylase OafA/YrhL, contains acyltransferase and SGNH-hydrolase domains [Spirosoma fluviale]
MSMKVKESSHLSFLDGLRAIAALYVVLYHAKMQVIDKPKIQIVNLLGRMFDFGHYAVDVFIVISGFCLMLPVVKNKGILPRSTFDFIKRRAKRILPPYYLSIVFALILIATLIGEKTNTHWDTSIPVSIFDILTHLVLIQDIFLDSSTKISHSLWSVSVEWRIYLLFPAMLIFWRSKGPFIVTFLAIFISCLLWFSLDVMTIPNLNMTEYGMCIHYIGLFAMGMLAAEISFSMQPFYGKIRQNISGMHLQYLPFLIFMVAMALKNYTHWVLIDILIGCSASTLLIGLSTNKLNKVKRLLSWNPLVFIGTFAYSIYLVHPPLLQVIHQYFLNPLNLSTDALLIVFLFVSPIFVVFLAYIFFLVAEKPFIPGKKHKSYDIAKVTVNS